MIFCSKNSNLVIPSKNLSPKKTETNQVFTFQFLMIKFTVIPKKKLPLGNLAKLVFWSILSFKNWKVNTWFVSVFFGDKFLSGLSFNSFHTFAKNHSISKTVLFTLADIMHIKSMQYCWHLSRNVNNTALENVDVTTYIIHPFAMLNLSQIAGCNGYSLIFKQKNQVFEYWKMIISCLRIHEYQFHPGLWLQHWKIQI